MTLPHAICKGSWLPTPIYPRAPPFKSVDVSPQWRGLGGGNYLPRLVTPQGGRRISFNVFGHKCGLSFIWRSFSVARGAQHLGFLTRLAAALSSLLLSYFLHRLPHRLSAGARSSSEHSASYLSCLLDCGSRGAHARFMKSDGNPVPWAGLPCAHVRFGGDSLSPTEGDTHGHAALGQDRR